MTARDLVNNVKLDDKFVDDTINAAVEAATQRINGKVDNEGYQKKIEEIKKNVEARKQQEKRIAAIKASQQIQIQQKDQNGSNSVGAGVSAPVQNKV